MVDLEASANVRISPKGYTVVQYLMSTTQSHKQAVEKGKEGNQMPFGRPRVDYERAIGWPLTTMGKTSEVMG